MSRPTSWQLASTLAVVVILAACAVGAASWKRVDWRSWLSLPSAPSAAAAAPVSRDITPHAAAPRETTARPRQYAGTFGGRLGDALAILDAIRPTDRPERLSDRLRADIQRQLLALSSVATPDAEARDKTGGRLP